MVKVFNSYDKFQGRRARDRMVVRFTATCAISAYHVLSCEFESCIWRVVLDTTLCDKVCQCLWQVSSFLRVFWFLPPIKPTATI